jgi:hypothetical protein
VATKPPLHSLSIVTVAAQTGSGAVRTDASTYGTSTPSALNRNQYEVSAVSPSTAIVP